MRREQEPTTTPTHYYIEEPYQEVNSALLKEIQEFYNQQVPNNKDEFEWRFGFQISDSFHPDSSFLRPIYQPKYALEYVAVARAESDRKTLVGVAELTEKQLERDNFPLHPFKRAYELTWFTNQQNSEIAQNLLLKLATFGLLRGVTEFYLSCDRSNTTTESIVHTLGKNLKGRIHPHTDYTHEIREYLIVAPPILPHNIANTFESA